MSLVSTRFSGDPQSGYLPPLPQVFFMILPAGGVREIGLVLERAASPFVKGLDGLYKRSTASKYEQISLWIRNDF